MINMPAEEQHKTKPAAAQISRSAKGFVIKNVMPRWTDAVLGGLKFDLVHSCAQ